MSGALPLDELGRILAEPTRLRILQELAGGPALPAGAVAARLGLAASTTSGHLARLADAGLIHLEQDGRRRLARLTDPAAAQAVEALLRLSDEAPVTSQAGYRRRRAMREARSCYDHLAGRVAVAVADLAVERGWVEAADGAWALPGGDPSPMSRGLELPLPWEASSRPAVLVCEDWTERRPHLAGRLGNALLRALLDGGWLRRRRDDRAVTITPLGEERLTALGVGVGP